MTHQSLNGVDVVLLDIEGTICPITFVKDTLFPYAISALPTVLREKWTDLDFKTYIDAFPSEHRTSPATIQAHVEDLTKRDVKIAYLKNLQASDELGYLWQSGYETKSYATPLYPDVVPRLRAWISTGKKIAIYSSGSVFAQKLLFAHVKTDTATNPDPRSVADTEDLTELVAGWFDTVNAGLKSDVGSYKAIARDLGVESGRMLFLSDGVREVEAAREAGMSAVVVVRSGNAPITMEEEKRLGVIKSFAQLDV